jgi:hypothetical protein
VATLQQQLAEARQRTATAEARLGMAQPRPQAMNQPYAAERVNLVRHGRGFRGRSKLPGAEGRAVSDQFVRGRSVNGQFGMRPQGHEDHEAQRGRFSRRFLVEVEGTGPTRPSLVRGRQGSMYGTLGAWTAAPSRESRAPTPSRSTLGNNDDDGISRSQSKDRESEGGVEDSERQAEDDIPAVRPTKAAGKKRRS